MEPDYEIEEFLRSRDVSEEVILKMRDEKIDSHVVCLMNEENLANFILKYGDRVALKEFCNKKNNPNMKKQSLLDKLRRKIRKARKDGNSSSDEDNSTRNKKKMKIGNWKETRQIELGWLCSTNGDKYVQMRTKQGGGTRKISVPKTATKQFIQEKAVELFFPANVSTKGHIDKFSVQLWDFKSNIINEDCSIEEMFLLSGLPRLRFYLVTKEISCTVTSGSIDTIEENEITEPASIYNLNATHEQDAYPTDLYTQLINETILMDYPQNHPTPSLLIPADNVSYSDQSPDIVLHRGQVFDELINAFYLLDKNCGPLNIKMLLPNGNAEMGIDFGGVFRDALTEFWTTFYSKCTVGTNAKIPYIRHDFDSSKWTTIAKILYFGWTHLKYFPVELSATFMEYCVTGEIKSDIVESFFKYLSKNETETLKTALDSFDSVDMEELLEVMGNLDCKLLLNKDNIKKVVHDMSHKEIIQKPMYVIDCWHSVLANMVTISELNDIYEKCKVTSKNVLSLLVVNNILNSTESKILGFLKKFIREMDDGNLKSFLRFCTGADVITKNEININFVDKEGLARAPVAHTCSCVLEVPVSYENFPEFRTEFESVLKSNIWVMDFA